MISTISKGEIAMSIPKKLGSRGAGIDLKICGIFSQRANKNYAAEEWLFHESTPRQWAGTILEGEVTITRGLHGTTPASGRLGPGALISRKRPDLEDTAHSTGAFTRTGPRSGRSPRRSQPFGRRSRTSSTASWPAPHGASATACACRIRTTGRR
jgi:hypothetical protein